MRVSTFILAAMFYACSGLRLPQPLSVDDSDWPMFGKYESRINATSEIITPPLTLSWDYDITGGIGNGSPLVIDSVLIVGNLRGELWAINAYTGKRIGWIDLGDAIQGTPVIDGSIAIISLSNSDLSLIAFDLEEGKPLWRKEYGDIEASPLLHNQKIYFGNTDGIFFCADKTTGEQLWKFELPGNEKHKGIRSSAASSNNTIVFGAEDGVVYALDAETGNLKWKHNTGATVVSSPCIADGNVHVGNLKGIVSAIDVQSGALQWRVDAGSSIYASASFADGKIVVGTTGGLMYGLDASTGREMWKSNLGGVVNSGAVVAGNTIYVGTLKKSLFGLNVTDGSIIFKQEVQGRIKTSPAVANGRLFVATDEKLVLAFKGAAP
ncbi:MAG: 3 protein [Bacteroidetes bacterium]|nr:3 protein [Bacteroidota bacterium]